MTSPVTVVQPPAPPRADALARVPPPRKGVSLDAAPSVGGVHSHRLAVVRIVGVVVTAIGALAALLLAYEFVLSNLPASRQQSELLATFKQLVPTTTLDEPSQTPAEGGPIALLTISKLGLSQVVVEGSSPTDLKLGPGHLSSSPLPGEYGNAVIEGRRTTYGSPFGRLESLRRGDTISVATGQGQFTYTVSAIKHVASGQADVIGSSDDSRLTLVTSDPAYIATGRLAVVAKLNGNPVAVATRPSVLDDRQDLGLIGDPLGLGIGLIWSGLLAGAVFAAIRLRRRLPPSVLYLFAAPVVATLALMACASLDSLLPGTL